MGALPTWPHGLLASVVKKRRALNGDFTQVLMDEEMGARTGLTGFLVVGVA